VSPAAAAFDRLVQALQAGLVRLREHDDAQIAALLAQGLTARAVAERLDISTAIVMRVRRGVT
jgi:hypothetical protein